MGEGDRSRCDVAAATAAAQVAQVGRQVASLGNSDSLDDVQLVVASCQSQVSHHHAAWVKTPQLESHDACHVVH